MEAACKCVSGRQCGRWWWCSDRWYSEKGSVGGGLEGCVMRMRVWEEVWQETVCVGGGVGGGENNSGGCDTEDMEW